MRIAAAPLLLLPLLFTLFAPVSLLRGDAPKPAAPATPALPAWK